jgi:hypothetical protein
MVTTLARAGRRPHRPAFAAACIASLAGWTAIRIPTARAIHGAITGQCARLEMEPSDWICGAPLRSVLVRYLLASVAVSLAVVVPVFVLAMRGRRVLAFVPMLAPVAVILLGELGAWVWSGIWTSTSGPSMSPTFLGPWQPWASVEPIAAPWRPDHPVAIAVDLAILAAPVLAYILLFRPAPAPRWGLGWRAALLACGIAAGAAVAIEWAAHLVSDANVYVDGGWYPSGLILICFGLLLPLGPRRPLWVIPPVAILASLGPSTAIVATLYDYTAFSWFGAALPLALMGAAGTGAVALVARQRGLRSESQPQRRFRPAAVGYGAATGMLAVAVLMAVLARCPTRCRSACRRISARVSGSKTFGPA